MKPHSSICHAQARTGYLLIECLVYMSVLVVILGLALGAFYMCWDYSKALYYATDDINAALHAGERWRADIRNATGKITVEARPEGEVLQIPCGTSEVLYRFNAGEIRRQVASSDFSELLLPTVKASQMVMDARGPVSAWRWELELTPHRKETRLPMQFTFEAAAKPTP